MKKLFFIIFLIYSSFSYSQEYTDISDILPSKITLKEDYTILVNGEKIFPDVPPVEYQGLIFVPIRFISGALGAEISWSKEKREVYIKSGNREIVFVIGSLKARQNNKISSLLSPPFIYKGRTMIPLKWTAKSLGAKVKERKDSMEISYKVGILGASPDKNKTPSEVVKIKDSEHPGGVGWLRWKNFKVKIVNLLGYELRKEQNKAVGLLLIILWITSVYLYLSPLFKKFKGKKKIETEEIEEEEKNE